MAKRFCSLPYSYFLQDVTILQVSKATSHLVVYKERRHDLYLRDRVAFLLPTPLIGTLIYCILDNVSSLPSFIWLWRVLACERMIRCFIRNFCFLKMYDLNGWLLLENCQVIWRIKTLISQISLWLHMLLSALALKEVIYENTFALPQDSALLRCYG